MKNVYRLYMRQDYNGYEWLISYIVNKVFNKNKIPRQYDVIWATEKYILADSKQDAINIYKEKYNYEDEYKLNERTYYSHTYYIDKENLNLETNVVCTKVDTSFNVLKKELCYKDFYELCKQEMYPIDVVIDEK